MGGLAAGWLNIILSFLFPLFFFIYLLLRRRGQVLSFMVGLVTFTVAEILICVPLFQWLAGLPGMAGHPVAYTLLLALCAALLEGLSRWLAFRFVLRGRHSLADGVALGIGHGFVGVGLAAFGNLLMVLFFPAMLEGQSFASLAVVSAEGVLTLAMQVAVTLLVLRSVRQGSLAFLALGVGVHVLFRAVGALRYTGLGDWGQQALLLLITAVACVFVYKTRGALAGGGPGKTKRKKAAGIPEPGSLDENIWK